jgi:hypothetical protein
VFNPEPLGGGAGVGAHGFGIYLATTTTGDWQVDGTYAVTAP